MPPLLWILVLAADAVLGHTPGREDYIVNDLFDDSLETMIASLLEDGSGFVKLGHVTVGGFFLEGAELGDLSLLKRHGNITLSAVGTELTVSGFFEMPNMVVRGGNITSLDAIIINPVIRFNGYDGYWFNFWSEVTPRTCTNGYPLVRKYWTHGNVLLTSDSERHANEDITKFMRFYEDSISDVLEKALSETFSKHFGFCQIIERLQVS